jgi:hypothetical protein
MDKIALRIRKLAPALAVFAAAVALQSYVEPAQAQTGGCFRTWVTATGSDANTSSGCQPSNPCQSISAAITQTRPGGDVTCLGSIEPDAQPTVTITGPVTIDCQGTVAGITNVAAFGTISFNINATGAIVTLRGLSLHGDFGPPNGGGFAPATIGIQIQQAAAVNIENCVIEGFSQHGILDERTTGLTKLVIENTIVSNNAGAGIVLAAAPKNSVVLENVQSVGNGYGIGVATGNNVVISRSVMSENAIAGIEADPGAQVYVENTKISHNASFGVQALGTVVLANSDITFNNTSISGSTTSFGNNRLFGNGGGTAPTPAGGASTDFGQQ